MEQDRTHPGALCPRALPAPSVPRTRRHGTLDRHPSGSLLAAEREFGPGAFFRVIDFDDLICCLPGFVEPDWLLSMPADRRAQISLTWRLAEFLDRHRLIDRQRVSCAYWDVEGAVRRARQRDGRLSYES